MTKDDEIAKLKGIICGLECILRECYEFKSIPENFDVMFSLCSAPKYFVPIRGQINDRVYTVDELKKYVPNYFQ